MMHVIDGSEGALDSGRHPEAARLLVGQQAGESLHVCAPCDEWFGRGTGEQPARRLLSLPGIITWGRSVRRSDTDCVHAWSRKTAEWALRAESGVARELSLLESPSRVNRRTRRVGRRLSRFGRIRVLDAADAEAWKAAGAPEDGLHVEPPDPMRVRESILKWSERIGLPSDRASLRDLLRAEDDEFLVFPLASPWSGFDARRFVFLLGMLRINGTPATAIVPASGWRLVGARVFREQSRLGTRVCVIEGPMTPWLPAADAAFLDAERPRETLLSYRPRGALRVLIAAAQTAGVPVAIAPGSLLEADPRRAPSVADELRPLLMIAEQWNGRRTDRVQAPVAIRGCVHCGA
ncbi:MAG: hypothetical protein DYG94_05485 [Leptolyngbya sp. PLA3]|nr:MAG: hypothetical protein EDM82_04635 [Cyanobacteria bacterium CYA]MCE7968186.1 hypothetical protein [Leptolyngbya sp. PL-A3]